ncbi:MAG: transposase, partial [Candidatus Nitrosocosmicus sp.]
DYIVIAIDSTGIKVTNRGQWIRRDKWKIKKKGYLKIHIVVNIKSRKILSMKVAADKHAHDSKALPELVENIIKSDSRQITVSKLFVDDGTYDGNDIFRCIADDGMLPCIKVRKNATVQLKTDHILRNLSVIAQKNDLQKWKDRIVSYGNRWIVETVFSSIKRMFDREMFIRLD